MNYTIYIQAQNNFPIDDWAVSAYLGFRARQANIIFFEDIHEVPLSKSTILIADIPTSNTWLEAMGGEGKKSINIPAELSSYTKRRYHNITFEELLADKSKQFPLFIKPAGRAKEFIAGVVSTRKNLEFFYHLDPTTKVFVSEVVDIVSEYRCYVTNGELKGIKHYSGDIRLFPSIEMIDGCIREYISSPTGYTIDFGILATGKTVLIEVNDGFAIGNYGLDNSLYVSLLCARWLEILKDLPQFPRFSPQEWSNLATKTKEHDTNPN